MGAQWHLCGDEDAREKSFNGTTQLTVGLHPRVCYGAPGPPVRAAGELEAVLFTVLVCPVLRPCGDGGVPLAF